MPDTSEESAVLNLDSGNTLAAIHHALEAYARTVPNAAVAKILFEQKPDVSDGGFWQAGVTLQCYGQLEHKGEVPKEGQSFLTNVEPQVVHTQQWTAEGMGFAGAVEELRDVVENQLQNLISRHQQDLEVASQALRFLRNPNELDNVWATSDNPQDDPADEHDAQEGQ